MRTRPAETGAPVGLEFLRTLLKGAKGQGASFTAQCPAHDDQHNSLSISHGDAGRILLHCHAGCTPEAILETLDLSMADLFESMPETGRKPEIVKTYDYVSADGELLYQVVRYYPKDFRQRRPDLDRRGEWVWNLKDTPRVLFHLPQLIEAIKAGVDVFVVEGEKDALTLEALGLVATTNAGGAAKWCKSYTDVLADARRVIVLPDNDPPGRAHAERIRAELPNAVIVELPGLPEHGDVSDWVAGGGTRDGLLDAVAKYARAAGVVEVVEWPREAEPLRRDPDPPVPFPVAALGAALAPAARRIAEVVQVDDALPSQSLLVSASLAAQPHGNVVVDGRVTPLSLYCVAIAESGDRKTTVDRLAMASHARYEEHLQNQYHTDLPAAKRAVDAFEAAYKHVLAVNKKNPWRDVQAALAALGERPEPPPLPVHLCGEPTYEGLAKALAYGQPTMGLFNDDGAMLLYGAAFSDDHAIKTASGLSRIWDGAPMTRVRAGDGVLIIQHKRLALHLMIQPAIAPRLFADPTLRGQGFTARFLTCWPRHRGVRTYQRVDLSADPAVVNAHNAITALLEKPYRCRQNPKTGEVVVGELDPPGLTLDTEAMDLYVAYHDHVEAQRIPSGPMHPIREWSAKAPEHMLRIAGVLALLDDPDALTIGGTVMDRAIQIADFYAVETIRLNGSAIADPDVLAAEALLEWAIQWQGEHPEWAVREVVHFGPSSIRDTERVRYLLGMLEQHGLARRRTLKPERWEARTL